MRYIPKRPTTIVVNDVTLPLNYRNHPRDEKVTVRFFEPKSMAIQWWLYRFSRSLDFCNSFFVEDVQLSLHREFPLLNLSNTYLIKKILDNALRYDSTFSKFIHRTKHDTAHPIASRKPTNTTRRMFVIRHREELQYGLEWMICAWARRVMHPQGNQYPSIEEMEDTLEELAESTTQEFEENWLRPAGSENISEMEPDWIRLFQNGTLDREDDIIPDDIRKRRLMSEIIDSARRVVWIPPEDPPF